MTPEEFFEYGKKLLKSKGEDYTTNREKDRYENFDRSSSVIAWFSNDIDRAFVALITTKLARLASLLGRESEPNNESIEDTFVDLVNYAALWGGRRTQNAKNETGSPVRDVILGKQAETVTEQIDPICFFCNKSILRSRGLVASEFAVAHYSCLEASYRETEKKFWGIYPNE